MYKKYILVWALAIAVVAGLSGCEKSTEIEDPSESGWVQLGWETLAARDEMADIELAHTYFGNALKIDTTYAAAYTGDGWAYIYEHNTDGAMSAFQEGFLFAGSLADTEAHKRLLYIGAMVALHAADDYTNSVTYGAVYSGMDPDRSFVHPYDSTFSAYDALMIMTLDYFALGDATNVTFYINELIDIINGTAFTFTTWDACAAKIGELQTLDPS